MNKTAAIFVLFSVFLVGCSTTKSLKEGDVLFKGERIQFKKNSENAQWKMQEASDKYASVYWTMWDAPNGALFGMPFVMFYPLRLYIYNDFYNDKDHGFSYWMRANFGEAPKTITYVNPEIKIQKGISVFEEYGHFGTTGHFKLNYNKKGNKAYVRYFFKIKEAYIYRNVQFGGLPNHPKLEKQVIDFGKTSLVKPNTEFNLYTLKSEKNHLVNSLQDSGYYFILNKNLIIEADTALKSKRLDLKISVDKNLPNAFYQQQYLNDVQINLDSVVQPKTPGKYFYWRTGKLKTKVLDSVIDIKSNSRYSLAQTKRTNMLLSDLGIFSNPRINYSVINGDSIHLHPIITLDVLDATNIGFNIKGNYKNTGYIGPSVGFIFRQLNVFNGAENLTVNGDLYYDFPIGKFKHRVSNSYGVSLRSILTKPLLATPFKFINHKTSLPKQFYRLNIDYNIRQDYFDLVTLNATYGWVWKTKPNVTHIVGLIDVTMSSIKNTTQLFDDLVAQNPLLKATLINQFLLGTYYEFNYLKTANIYQRWDFGFTGRADFSGNLLNMFSSIFTHTPVGEQEFMGIKYAQFSRFSTEVIANWHISKTHHLVFRSLGGIGLAYNNSKNMPFIKQYFIGGTNSLRPYNARVVGPGRYLQANPAEVNQVGDFKLEFNIEYRMPLFWKLNFAIFTDMGNIWLLHPDPNRPKGEVRWGKLLEDSYLTAGLGLRFDMDYLVLRLDVGVPMYNPVLGSGQRWVWQNKIFGWSPVFGIGYPF